MRRMGIILTPLVAAGLIAAGCSGSPSREKPSAAPAGATEDGDVGRTEPASVGVEPAATPARPPSIFPGSGTLVGEPPAPVSRTSSSAEGIQLSFVETEIATVVASVLGDGLGAAYVIDPAIKGTMSLQSSRPLARDELVPALEAALRLHEVAITQVDGTYRVIPLKDAPRQVGTLRHSTGTARPGFGIQIIPLRYVSALDMQKVLEPLVPQGSVLRVDEARNLLLVAGSSQEIRSMLDAVATFDVDWLSGMSFALFNLTYVDAQTITSELSEIFGDPKSPLAGLVRLVPIPRLNAVLTITPQPKYLTEVETWIKRLDLGGSSPGRRIYVYDVQNGKAGGIADSLTRILSLSGGEDAPVAGEAALAAGAGPQTPRVYEQVAFAEESAGQTALNSGALKIVPNEENNSLLILATPSEFGVIEQALQRLDVLPRQVLIEASLAEVTLNDDLKYGVQWSYLSGDGTITLSESPTGSVAQRFPGFSYLFTGREDIRAVLNAIESVTSVNVISSPKLLVLNNREASLQIGDQVPIAVQSAVGVGTPDAPIVNAVQLKDTGVILRVTPRVNKSGLVILDIAQEVSDVVATTSSGIDSPTIQQRKLTSTVAVRSGETIALGGLIRDRTSKSRSGVPFLSKIPGIGALFRSTNDTKGRTELIVLITPRVLRDDTEFEDVMQSLKDKFRKLSDAFPSPQTP